MNLNDFIYKTNSPELEAHFEQFGKKFYIDADEINSIVDTLKLMSNNVASSGFIEKKAHGIFGQEYVIAAFFKWAIENNLYSNLTQVTLAIPYASAGKTRFERIAATTEDTFIRVVGEESSAAAVLPDLPADTLELTHYLVRDNAIDNPIPVVPVGTFVEKATYTPMALTNAGVVGSFEMDKRAAIKATGALTELGNIIKNNSTHHFHGQLFVFIDATPAGGVKLPHLYTGGGPGSIAWFHPDGEDYVTQQGEVVLFVEDTVGSQIVNRRISSSLRNRSVTVEKLQDIPSGRIFGRTAPGTGQSDLLDSIDVLEMLGLENVVYDLATKQKLPIVTTTNDTGLKGEVHHNIGNNIYTDDPSPVLGKGYHVLNISGSPTIGGVVFTRKGLFSRMYNGTIWTTTPPFKDSYRQNNGFDFIFDKPGTFAGVAINGGTTSTSPNGYTNSFVNNAFTIRGSASNANSGAKYYILNNRAIFVGDVIFTVFKPERLTDTFMRFGLQQNEAFTPNVDESSMFCVEVANNILSFKTAVTGMTSIASPTLTLLNMDWLMALFTVESASAVRCIIKNSIGGVELYNKVLTTNLPLSTENSSGGVQMRFILAATSNIASSGQLVQINRISHFNELPNWLKDF